MTQKTFADLRREDRRLVLLRLLAESDDYSASIYLLHMAMPGMGHNCSEDALRADIAWLAEQGLLSASTISDLLIAKLTGRGADVAAGRARVPGVKRPRPE